MNGWRAMGWEGSRVPLPVRRPSGFMARAAKLPDSRPHPELLPPFSSFASPLPASHFPELSFLLFWELMDGGGERWMESILRGTWVHGALLPTTKPSPKQLLVTG